GRAVAAAAGRGDGARELVSGVEGDSAAAAGAADITRLNGVAAFGEDRARAGDGSELKPDRASGAGAVAGAGPRGAVRGDRAVEGGGTRDDELDGAAAGAGEPLVP